MRFYASHSLLRRQRKHPRLHLGMTVCTKQHALLGLGSRTRYGSRGAETQGEPLVLGLPVMKLESRDASIVAARSTCAPRLLNKHALDLTATPRHRLGATLETPVSAAAPALELGRAVSCTLPNHDVDGLPSVLDRGATLFGATGLQAVLAHPMPNGGLAAPDRGGDLGN